MFDEGDCEWLLGGAMAEGDMAKAVFHWSMMGVGFHWTSSGIGTESWITIEGAVWSFGCPNVAGY